MGQKAPHRYRRVGGRQEIELGVFDLLLYRPSVKPASARHFDQVVFEGRSGFEHPPLSDRNEYERRANGVEIGLAASEIADETRAPGEQRHGLDTLIGWPLCVRSRRKQKQESGRPRRARKPPRRVRNGPVLFIIHCKTADSGFKNQLGRPSRMGQVTFLEGVLGEVFPNGARGRGFQGIFRPGP